MNKIISKSSSKLSLEEKRKIKDVKTLKEMLSTSDFKEIKKNIEYSIKIKGPKDTIYEGAHFVVNIYLPEKYPFASPSVAFITKVYHPNIHIDTGSICLDVINEKWTVMYSLKNIYDTFLPQLLTYPNPDDPLNREASYYYKYNREEYNKIAKQYIQAYCK